MINNLQLVIFKRILTMSVFVWAVLLLLNIAVMAHQLLIIGALSEFEVDHINPLDLCASLEGKVKSLLGFEAAVCFVSLFDIKWGVLVFLMHIVSVIWVGTARRNRPRYFDPVVIVRDNWKIRKRHVILAFLDGFSFPVIILMLLFAIFQ